MRQAAMEGPTGQGHAVPAGAARARSDPAVGRLHHDGVVARIPSLEQVRVPSSPITASYMSVPGRWMSASCTVVMIAMPRQRTLHVSRVQAVKGQVLGQSIQQCSVVDGHLEPRRIAVLGTRP